MSDRVRTDLSSPWCWGRCRVQEEAKWRQQLLSQNDKLLQSLRVELRVYEKLDEEHRTPRGTGHASPQPLSARTLCHGLPAHPDRGVRILA